MDKIDLEILFADVLHRKKGFPDKEERPSYRVAILTIFPKGLTHGYVKNSKFDLSLVLVNIYLELMFVGVLDRKKVFPDYKNVHFTESHTSDFSKGVNPWFKLKN